MYKPNFDSGAQLNPDDQVLKRGDLVWVHTSALNSERKNPHIEVFEGTIVGGRNFATCLETGKTCYDHFIQFKNLGRTFYEFVDENDIYLHWSDIQDDYPGVIPG